MRNITVKTASSAYDINIGAKLLENPTLLQAVLGDKPVAIVSNEAIAKHYLPKLRLALQRISSQMIDDIPIILLPEGETHKNYAALQQIYDALLAAQLMRDTTLIALGGGIVGDITGFAAATYLRGIDFIQIPTTLLAQVDSSVGGKTGINHPQGKNLIGAFYPPKKVIIDTDVLVTLPTRELSAGLAEVIKYGLILDSKFLSDLVQLIPRVQEHDSEALAQVIEQSCRFKARVVEQDEKEKGLRAILNLGHTFGHALEALTHYEAYLHGEAVAIGTMMALSMSKIRYSLPDTDIAQVQQLFQLAGCPTYVSHDLQSQYQLTPERLYEKMRLDKKVQGQQIHLVLLEQLGQAVVTRAERSDIIAAINDYLC